MKQCKQCKKSKELKYFYFLANSRTKHESKCKECRNKYFTEHGRTIKEKRRIWVRKSAERQDFKKRRSIYMKKWVEENREKIKNYRKKYIFKNRTRQRTKAAIKSGKLIKNPCEKCGSKKVDVHHIDYSKPLDVRWLCRKHHMLMHRKS